MNKRNTDASILDREGRDFFQGRGIKAGEISVSSLSIIGRSRPVPQRRSKE